MAEGRVTFRLQAPDAKSVKVQPGGTDNGRFAAGLKAMHAGRDAAGVKHVVYESPVTSHEWQTWRRSLHDLAARLFRD